MAQGGTPIKDVRQYINQSGMAEGLVGGELPVVVFYYPVLPTSKYLPKNGTVRHIALHIALHHDHCITGYFLFTFP